MRTQTTAPSTPGISPGLRRYLYFSAGVTGGSIMIIQILGAKMLAPFVGTSHFVWTAQIAITLIALAAGYYAGGRLADASPKLARLYWCILAASVYLASTLLVVKPVAYWCLQFKLALGSLLASTFLFFIPLALLAMVGPFFVRVLTLSVASVGGNIGRLTAISTLGSFAGTVLIGYVLLPILPNSITLFLTSGLLMAIVAGYFFVWEFRATPKTPLAALVLLGLALGFAAVRKDASASFTNVTEKFRGNSDFGLLQVVENKQGNRRFYLNDFLIQNTYDPREKKSVSVFTYALHDLAFSYTPQIKSALCIGMGVGIVPMEMANAGIAVDVVEINPAVVPLAKQFFDCDPSKFRLEIGDGRYFVSQSQKQYDTIVLDAFLGDSSPSHLMSQEAFASMKRALSPQGTLVINSFGDFSPGRDFYMASLHKTLRRVFAQVKIHAPGNGNVFFVASDQPELAILRQPNFDRVHESCRQSARDAFLFLAETNPESGIVITDNYNPIDFYDAPSREKHRRQLALYIKSL